MKENKRTILPRVLGTLAAVAAVVAVAALVPILLKPGRRRPNVLLISIDSLRPDHLGCYGYARNTSPTLDRLANEGVLFDTVVSSSSWTLPAHAALFTGLPDRVHGCFESDRWLDGSRETLAEAFKKAGYRTVGFFSGPFLHPGFGLAQGFDSYHDCTSYSARTIAQIKKGDLTKDLLKLSHADITNPIILREVTKWLEQQGDEPFFAFIHLWDVHFDYIPPPPYDTMFDPDYDGSVDGRGMVEVRKRPAAWSDRDVEHVKALYDGEIRYTDDTLGKILNVLDQHAGAENTIIAVTADHGEAFFEHGVQGHRLTLYEEEIRIPLVIRWPRGVPAGRRIARPAHITDIAPTLLELADRAPLPDALGMSLVPLIRDYDVEWPDRQGISELVVYAFGTHLFSMRAPAWKAIIDLSHAKHEVFDLNADPQEAASLRTEQFPFRPVPLKRLYRRAAGKMQAAARRLPAPGERDTPAIDKMTEAQLRSLGYLK